MGTPPRGTDESDPAERELLVDDAHRSVTLMALLFFLWGAVSLLTVPRHPFGIPNALQAVVGGAASVYFLRTRARPNARVDGAFAAVVLTYSLLLLPWTAVAWSALRRPWEAFTVPEVGIVLMALVVPRFFWLGILLVALFAAESAFVLVYARHVGLGALLPTTEPAGTLAATALGVGLLVLREQRRQRARRYLRVHAETEALRRLGPLFASFREEIHAQLGQITEELRALEGAAGPSTAIPRMAKAVDRLVGVSEKLGRLTGAHAAPPPPPREYAAALPPRWRPRDLSENERRFAASDAHTGATLFAVLITAIGGVGVLLRQSSDAAPAPYVVLTLAALACLGYLLRTRQRPSEAWSLLTIALLWGAGLVTAPDNQEMLLALHRPYAPNLGLKLLMVIVAVAAASRLSLSVVLVVATALEILALYFAQHLDAHKDLIPLAEPWTVLAYLLIALVSLRMSEQRRVASLQLLRAESERTALRRRAGLFLALRDQLNSPLQTLVLGTTQLELRQPSLQLARVRAGIDRLIALSRQLAELDPFVPSGSHRASLDSEHELRHYS